MYVLNILTKEIFEKNINIFEITLSNPAKKINIVDLLAINLETLKIDNKCYLEKIFIELIRMNLSRKLYLTVN